MTDAAIKDALRAAARQFCICDGECYETRHGMMNGPCEQRTGQAAATVAAFHRHLEAHYALRAKVGIGTEQPVYQHRHLAAAVEKAARDE